MSTVGAFSVLIAGLAVVLLVVAWLNASRRDPTAFLTVYLLLLFWVPAALVVGPLGGAGTPAVIVALGAAWWWGVARLTPSLGLRSEWQPVRWALLCYLWFCLVSWSLSRLRPLTELEINESNRGLIALVAAIGVAMLIADGVRDRARLDQLLRVLVLGGSGMAFLGVLQFGGIDLVQYIRIPGLTLQRELLGIGSRSIFNRPFGTALHPIEFGVVCTALLPIALHLFFYERSQRRRRLALVGAGLLAAAGPMSVSRSAIISLVLGYVVLNFAWSWRRRLEAGVVAVTFAFSMWALVPGLLGTIRNMFTKAGEDDSVTARVDRVPAVIELWRESPWVGRGYQTYSPLDYFLLDNEIYVTVIEVGVVGLLLTLIVIGVGVGTARGARHRSLDPSVRHLGQALAASTVALASSMATFDAFFYRILYGTLFVLLGCSGALWAIVRDGTPAPYDPSRKEHDRPVRLPRTDSRTRRTAP